MQKTTLKISGMSCKSCAKIIEYTLGDEKGVGSATVDFNLGQAFLEFDPEKTDILKIKNKIKDLGYKAA